jgi:dipeptidyl aminopeptidase/acylaminoacyl peptidase
MTWGIALALALAAGAPFSVDDLLALPRVSAPALSPDGTAVAFAVARAAPGGGAMDSALFVLPAAGGDPRRLTPAELGGYAPRFSPDGGRIAFVGVAAGDAQAWVADAAGGAPRKVTSIPGGVDAVGWMPDGRSLLVIATAAPGCGADPDCSAAAFKAADGRPRVATQLLFRHWDSWRLGVRSHVFRVPLDGAPPVNLTPGDRDVPPWQRGGLGDLAVSPDGRTFTFTAVTDGVEATSTNGDLYAVAIAGGRPARLTSGKGWDGTPRLSPDGRRLAWRSLERPGYESDRGRILVGAADGSEPRELTAGVDLSVDELYWTGDGKAIRFLAQSGGRRRLFEVELASRRVRPLTGDLNVVEIAPSADGRVAAAVLSSFAEPPELFLLEPGKGEGPPVVARRLTFLTREVMARVELGSVAPFEARAKDGHAVPGWIARPPGLAPGAKPAGVLFLHGGPEDAWLDEWHWRWNAMLWTAQGYALAMPNPRGSTGFGQAWVDAVRNDWNGAPLDDVVAFLDAAVAAGALDGDRACAAGASYGGYLAHVLNGRTERFKCLVSHASLFDVELAWYGTDELWFPEWEFGIPWEHEADLARLSPRRQVARWRTPSLVTHGELDYRVALGQALGAFQALQRRGIASRLVTFPDEGHWILKPRNVRAFHDEVFGWLRRWLPPASPPAAVTPPSRTPPKRATKK